MASPRKPSALAVLERSATSMLREQEEQEMDNLPAMPPPPPVRNQPANAVVPPVGNLRPNRRPRDDARFEPQFEPLQPAFADLDAQDDGAVSPVFVALIWTSRLASALISPHYPTLYMIRRWK